MISACTLLVALALGILLVLLVPWIVVRILAQWARVRERDQEHHPFCDWLCRIRIALALLLGLAIGALLYACREELARAFQDAPPCLAVLLLLLLLAFLAAAWFILRLFECDIELRLPPLWGDRKPVEPGRSPGATGWVGYTPYALALLLALIVLVLVIRACGEPLGRLLFASLCGKLLLLVILLVIAFLVVRALEMRLCPRRQPDRTCCRETLRSRLIILLLLLLAALIVTRLCGDDLKQRDFDLAMVGIFWDGKYTGERGAHLRWAFRYGLPFPQGGFDLYRRTAGSSPWTLLNTEGRIHPARVWDGTVPGPGVIWRGRGKDRLPAIVHPQYEAANAPSFDYLREMVGRPPYQMLYYVEGRDLPFGNQTDANTFAGAFTEPLAQWQLEPMTLLITMALHPEVARLLGLYYIDLTADSTETYDYRVVGYWSDRTRSYTTRDLSLANTQPLTGPPMHAVAAIPTPTRDMPDGSVWPTEAVVGARWEPPTPTPDESLTPSDGIKPVLFALERQDVGPPDSAGTPTPTGYARLLSPDDTGAFVSVDPVAVTPEEVEGAPDRWPAYFAYDNYVDYRSYAYRVVGIDVFGRESPPSQPLIVSVRDLMGPPAPSDVEARIYQRSDPAVSKLVSSLRNALFPAGSTHEYALLASWLWPHSIRDRIPDVKEFQVHYKFTGYESFADPSQVGTWRDVASWEGTLSTVSMSSVQPALPQRYEVPGSSPVAYTVPASDYYEIAIPLPAAAEAAIGADDDRPVAYGMITVGSVDHDPFNNLGPAASPVVVVSRDFTPPNAPAAPLLTKAPGPPDKSGYAHLTLRVGGADVRYKYEFHRVRGRALLSPPASTGALPTACAADTNASGVALQQRAYHTSSRYVMASAIPIPGTNIGGTVASEFIDRVDGTVSQRFVYAARAIDPAGNKSAFSCPSFSVLARDGMPPRAPVLTRARGGQRSTLLTWVGNSEPDIDRYELYRTADDARLNSTRKMTLVLAVDAAGNSVAPTAGAANATVTNVSTSEDRLDWTDTPLLAGRDYFYRLVAVDLAGNTSEMSDPVRARAIDTLPPAAPQWAAANAVTWTTSGSQQALSLTWQAIPGESDVQVQVQRRQGATGAWLAISGWVTGTTYVDAAVKTSTQYSYRLRAMDALGNRGAWSTVSVSP